MSGEFESVYFLRFGEIPNVKRIPFGAKVDFMPSPTIKSAQPDAWEEKAILGIFLGPHFHLGRGRGVGQVIIFAHLRICAELEYFVDNFNLVRL